MGEIASDDPGAPARGATNQTIWLFDGLCGFCDASVRFYLAHERDDRCRFVAIQSPLGRSISRDHGIDPDEPSTFLFIEDGVAHGRSAGVIAMARHLRAPWSLLRFWALMPEAWRDRQYDWVARNRYRIAGRKTACGIPSPEVRARFELPG